MIFTTNKLRPASVETAAKMSDDLSNPNLDASFDNVSVKSKSELEEEKMTEVVVPAEKPVPQRRPHPFAGPMGPEAQFQVLKTLFS